MSNFKFVTIGAVLAEGLIVASLLAANASPVSCQVNASPRSNFTDLNRTAPRSAALEVVAQKRADGAGSSSSSGEPLVGERSNIIFGPLQGRSP